MEKSIYAPKRTLPPDVEKFVKKLLKKGYGVLIFRDRNGKAYHAKVTNSGKLEEVFCN